MEDNCHVEKFQKEVRPEDMENTRVAYLAVDGMGCPRCALRVQNGLNRTKGVFDASVYFEHQVAEVYYDEIQVQVQDLLNAVASAGDAQKHRYRAQVIER